MHQHFLQIKASKAFQWTVIVVIVLSSILVGAKTYSMSNTVVTVLYYADLLVTLFFTAEILVRFMAEKTKSHFFKNGWNIFDSIIVISCLIPTNSADSVLLLRLLRLARLLRIISFMPELRFMVESLILSLKQSVNVILLIFLLTYVYGVLGVLLFSEIANARFITLDQALLALFQVMTLSSWETVMMPVTDIYPYAWMYFVSYVILSSVVVLNLFIAILVDVVSERKKLNSK